MTNKENTKEKKTKIYNSEELKFNICDKLLGSYISCLNFYPDKENKCKYIQIALNKIDICKIHV